MHDLTDLGWGPELQPHFASLPAAPPLRPARVVAEDRGLLQVVGPAGQHAARVTGRLRHHAASRLDLPSVGDWVAVDPDAQIQAVLPRKTAFVRRAAGDRSEPQVLAANVDVALLVTALNAEYNPRRIERWVTAAWDAGTQPVLVLNKTDLVDRPDDRVAKLGSLAGLLPRVAMSALTGDGVDELAPWLGRGRTLALLGSSGVGKSTLANRLLGEERQATKAIREDDAHGRHTTVRRELLVLPEGRGLLIDTPGLRELQLWWADSDGPGTVYEDVEEFARECRFRDCEHADEPGCAVQEAIRTHQLRPGRLNGYRKLLREQAHEERRQDSFLARRQQRARAKMIKRATRQRMKRRD